MAPETPQRIEPRTLKGFRDYLPEQAIPRERLIETARRVYRSYGFVPIDTPALEHEEVLTATFLTADVGKVYLLLKDSLANKPPTTPP